MRIGKRTRLVGVAVVAGLIGYVIGPPVVSAATTLVKIQHGRKGNQANVKKGKVWVLPRGGNTSVTGSNVFTVPRPTWGVDLLGTGSGNGPACDNGATVTDVVVNGGSEDFAVTMMGDGLDADETADDVMWSGTAAPGEQLAHTFSGGGLFVNASVDVNAMGAGGEWFVYGFCYGTAGAGAAGAAMGAAAKGTIRER